MFEKHLPIYKATSSDQYFDAHSMEEDSQMHEEILPFTVRIVQDEDDLEKAIRVRHSAYARHLPTLAETLREPEALDRSAGVVVLLAESKLDGSPIGSVRLQSNHFQPLAVEQSIELPDWLVGKSIVEVTRLSIAEGRAGRLVKSILMKSMYQYWIDNQIDYVIAAGRSPIDKQYEQLLFSDLFPGQGFIPLKHAANVPHRVMTVCVEMLEPRWEETNHPLTKLVFHTHHPDIKLIDMRHMSASKSIRHNFADYHHRLRT